MKLLIICSGNTCRSPMAAGLVTLISRVRGLSIDGRSAGLRPHPNKEVAENAVAVMNELGVDISSDYSKPVSSDLLTWSDYVIPVQRSLGDEVIEHFPEVGPKILHLECDVHDPYCGSIGEYRDVRNQLHQLLSRLVDSLNPSAS